MEILDQYCINYKTMCKFFQKICSAVLPLDLCEFSKHKEAFDTVLNKFGRLDVMIHNAGR